MRFYTNHLYNLDGMGRISRKCDRNKAGVSSQFARQGRDCLWHELEAETLLKLEAASCVAEIF